MANMLFANNCNTTLSSSLTTGATSMSVTSTTGFPSPTGVQYFYCTLADAATQTTIEIVKVTSVTGTTFTITRAQDGTSATAFAAGAIVSLRLVRASLNDFPKLDETNTFNADQAISGQLTTSAGLVATGTFTATPPSDGLVMDYATGFGRFSAFAGDGFQWYNAGVANTKLMQLSSSGVITTATWNGATIAVAYGGTGVTTSTGSGNSVLSTSPTLTTPIITTTLGVGGTTPSASGSGISFPATQSASSDSNTLDDYEKGTWTPTQGAGLVVVGTFTSSGTYTKVGRQVTISARLAGSTNISCTAGSVFTTGLPFAPAVVAAGAATSSNLAGTILYVDTTTYSVSAMGAAGAMYMTATYFV